MDRQKLSKEFYEHLTKKIIPFWVGLHDDEYGGYYGYMDYDLGLDKKAVKGCILNSRIMWFFANAYMLFKGDEVKALATAEENEGYAQLCLKEAQHAHDFMLKYCIDREYGGVLWAVNYDGSIADDIKHTYNQAFSIYALASYYDATGDSSALDEAYALSEVIESRCTDEIGYLEAFNRDFTPAANDKLSENGVMAEKTMNTLLHVFEAYTELLRVSKKYPEAASGRDTKIAARLRFMMDIIADKIYNPALRRQEVFFDKNYKSIIDLHSYGHDIETSWLVDRGLEILDDVMYVVKLAPNTQALADRIYERAYVNHSLLNECERGVDNKHRIWWVQAETVIGFMNAGFKVKRSERMLAARTEHNALGADNEAAIKSLEKPQSEKYFDAVEDVWDMIRTKLTDSRAGSEWFWELDENLEPIEGRPIVEPWKCPYHNGRMCIEMIKRLA